MTTTIVSDKEIEVYKKQTDTAKKFGTNLTVRDDEDYKSAMEKGIEIKKQLDAIVKRKEEITKPLNATLKSVRDLFKPIETTCESALTAIKSKMLEYTERKTREQEEAKLKLAQRVERGTMKAETAVAKIGAMPEQQKTVQSDIGKSTTKTVTKYRVIDKSKIPLEFLEPNMVAIKQSFKEGKPVGGIEVYEEKELALAY